MKLLITLLLPTLLCAGSAFSQEKQKEFRKSKLDGQGRVYFDETYNVNRRSDAEILHYAVEFANEKGSPTSDKAIDKEHNEVSFTYTFRLKKKEDFALGFTSMKATITVGARTERTNIRVHDITFTSTGLCKDGALESLLHCSGCSQRNINNIERWMSEEIGERFYWDYKHFLEEAVTRKRSWK